ncbi:MAG: PAS domain S-box protein, partial [Verrucomicrobiota bacterium]|nr:PAS domain S-box protein [Verrucomicrobiota bacterium]
TPCRRAARALQDSAERLRAILQTAVEGIISIDECGVVESLNPAAEKIFGYKAAELIGKSVSVLMPSPHRERHDEYLENYRRTGRAKIIGIGREVTGRRKDGSVFPMYLSVSEVKLADRRLYTGFIRDITERKRLEREILETGERERRRIGRDLHDGLCQQLAGIELMSQALEQKLARRDKAAAARAGEIAKNVREAIRHTRLLARGLSPVTLETEGLASALQELAAGAEKMFHITCRFAGGPTARTGDPAVASHLYRIAQEAVSNAIKHGRARRIFISLQNGRDRLALRVTDDGTGFPDPPALRGAAGHNGMGLRIMQARAGLIGGTLTIDRAPGGGVRVICSAPSRAPSPPAPAHAW